MNTPERTPVRVLVVDDEPHVLVMVAVMLRRAGFDAVAAESAEMAISMLERMAATGSLPDAILSDIQMPGMNGFAFAERLFAEPSTSAIPVVIVTGCASPDGTRQAPNVRGLVRKPFSPRHLVAELSRVLGRDIAAVKEAA